MDNNITILVDSVGRMIIGDLVKSSSKTSLKVKNPAVVNIQADQQSGQMSVQLLPYVFAEFVANDKDDEVVWDFPRSSVTVSDNLKLDDRITQQYVQIMENARVATVAPNTDEEPEVIKLFDE